MVFIFALGTVVALLWAGFQLFTVQEDPLADRREEMQAQAGIRKKQALASFVLGHMIFFVVLLGVMFYLQRDNPWSQKFGDVFAAGLLG